MKATVILLPLLGITWVFGILAVNENSVVFPWIFTVLNSLQVNVYKNNYNICHHFSIQGAFIFALHVLRNTMVCVYTCTWYI